MANYNLPDDPVFSTVLRKLETTDPAHADLFNALFLQLLINDQFLRKRTDRSCIVNPADGLKYEIGMDEGGVYITESDENPDAVVLETKTFEETDTVAVTVDSTTYGVKNAANSLSDDVPEGGVVFSVLN